MNARTSSLLLVLPLMAACSLVKLSDKVSQAHCKTNADCDVLNDRKSASFDACELWQCAADSKFCEFGALDADGDGYSPATASADKNALVCEAVPSKQDCDDHNPNRNPGLMEVCDGIDNNCDGNIDEGVLQKTLDSAIVFAGSNAAGIGDLTFAVDPESGTLGLGFSLTRTPNNVPGIAKIANGLPSGGSALEVKLPPLLPPNPQVLVTDGVGIGALGAESFAVAFYDRNGKRRVVAGSVDISAQMATLRAPSSTLIYGLRCEASEPCHANSGAPATVVQTDETGTPALAAIAADVLVTYVRNPKAEDAEVCHEKSDAVTAKSVLANWLQTSTQDGLTEVSTEALLLGKSDGVAPPAVLGIPPIGSQKKSFGWLVAYSDELGALQVVRVTAAGSQLTVSSPLFTLQDTKQRYSVPRLTLGPATDSAQRIGLTYQKGCSLQAHVEAAVFDADFDAGGAARLVEITMAAAVGGGQAEKHPAIAYSANRQSWGVVYRDPKGVRARVLDAQGKPVASAPYTLIDTAGTGMTKTEVLLSPAVTRVTDASDTGWFGAIGYVKEGGGTQYSFASATLSSCAKK